MVAVMLLLLSVHGVTASSATTSSTASTEGPPVAVTTVSPDEISARHRNLQFDIGPDPNISYIGFRLTLDYTVSASVNSENVRTSYYRDEGCNRRLDPDTEAAISTDIIPDATPTGGGTRTVRDLCPILVMFQLLFFGLCETS